MTHSGERTPAERDSGLDHLASSLDRAGRASNRVFVRWLLEAEVPLLAACVLFALDPEDAPVGMSDVAEAVGISVDDAARALHELRSLGYAREEGRRYEPTEKGEQLLASLTSARRDALAAFISGLSEAERREFVAVLGDLD